MKINRNSALEKQAVLGLIGTFSQWARRDILLSWDKSCRETIFVSQLSCKSPRCWGNFERGKMRSLMGERQFGRYLGVVRGLLGTDPPGPHPRIRLALPSQGSIWHWFNIDSTSIRHWFPDFALFWCQIDPWGGEGEVDSRVVSGGPVPNKPLTILGDNLGEGHCESKVVSRQWGHYHARRKSVSQVLFRRGMI